MPDDYFDELYAQAADPWDFETSAYEHEKYQRTLAALGDRHYGCAFEAGCSIGVLTALLTERCASVTATDVVAAALDNAQRRLDEIGRGAQVTFMRQSLDEPWPSGPFDLLVLSEVGYYLAPDALRSVLDRECPRLASGATVVAAHWRHHV